jgi:hypothetical protein
MGGLFYCSTSYTGQFYGNISCIGSMILLIFVFIISIPAKNNGNFPLADFIIMFPVIITILSIALTCYNIKKYREDIVSKKANTNYYLFNGMYVLSLGFIIIFQIFNLVMNHFYNFANTSLNNFIKYFIIFLSAANGGFSYMSHTYINL